MTDVLILGGTGWLSSRVAERWLEAGAKVTCVSRGTHSPPAGARQVVADRDAADAYAEVTGQDWDEVVDVSSQPRHVAAAVAALEGRAVHWSYVSSVSAYARDDVPGEDEQADLAAPAVDGAADDYSRAKSACEAAVRTLGERAAITRPGLIVGPGDPSDRFGYWPARFARAGSEPVLVPDATGLHLQVIDVDDLADFLVSSGARGWRGAVNAVGGSVPLEKGFDLIRAVTGHTGPVRVVSREHLERAHVGFWAGPRSLPLWLPEGMAGFATRSGAAYLAAGGRVRPLQDTVARVLEDERRRGLDRPRRAGLSPEEEHALLAAHR